MLLSFAFFSFFITHSTKAHFSNAGGQMSEDQKKRQRDQLISQIGEEAAQKIVQTET